MRTPTWVELLVLMVHGPADRGLADASASPGGAEPTLRGVLRSNAAAREHVGSLGWVVDGSAPVPVLAGAGAAADAVADTAADTAADGDVRLRAWRAGARVRIEDLDGSPRVVADDVTVWSFPRSTDRDGGGPLPTASPRSALVLAGSATHLLRRRDGNEFAGDDFTRPTGPVGATTFLGRPAWTVELAPPAHKPHAVQVVVDAATGLVLQQRVDAVGAVDEWVELALGEPLDPSLFAWTGPLHPTAPAGTAAGAARRQQDAERARWSAWFRDAVGPVAREVVVPVALDLSVQWLHTHDDATGAFEATLGEGFQQALLARRPRSAEPWDLSWSEVQHRWSTTLHDWAFTAVDLRPTAEGLAEVERSFSGGTEGPDEAAPSGTSG